ncbi:MAG: helix-turn-helix domain-containing protein, partial [Kiritimatiellae bacterium]|nr:helix-turn-helix domain-containing protein [Kiritimatiellia bacterium]
MARLRSPACGENGAAFYPPFFEKTSAKTIPPHGFVKGTDPSKSGDAPPERSGDAPTGRREKGGSVHNVVDICFRYLIFQRNSLKTSRKTRKISTRLSTLVDKFFLIFGTKRARMRAVMDTPRDFLAALRRGRLAAGLTQSALAQKVGCKQSALSMLEHGSATAVSRETLARIADAVGVELPPEPAAAVLAAAA